MATAYNGDVTIIIIGIVSAEYENKYSQSDEKCIVTLCSDSLS